MYKYGIGNDAGSKAQPLLKRFKCENLSCQVAELKERVQYRKVVTQHVLAEKTVCGVTIGRGTISVDYIPRKLFKFLSKLFGQVK